MDRITVRADWDEEAGVWVASSEDVDGIALEAATVEQLREKVMGAIADLIELDQIRLVGKDIPVHFKAESLTRLIVPAA